MLWGGAIIQLFTCMPAHFDTDAEDAKLKSLREQEEEDLARLLSDKYGIPYTDLTLIPVNADALRVISEVDAKAAQAVAFEKNGKHLSVALRSTEPDATRLLLEQLDTQGYIVEKFLISERGLNFALTKYADLSYAEQSKEGTFTINGTDSGSLSTITELKAHLDDALGAKKTAQVSHIFEGVLTSALAMKASDIHFEPEETVVRMRMRLDGQLTEVYTFDPHVYRLIESRIKILSGLKLNVVTRAQDGRFTVAVQGTDIEIRTSIIPGNYGESIVMRILDPNAINHSLNDLGIHPKLLERLATEIHRPNGMLLTTGPTGSGKTTTLYTFLQEVHTPEIKIITIEDPVEYHLPGIVQTQTDGADYTFATGLRSILRQDPDVIMVGEIRDAEVAEVAVQAALTGHFVFTTLHTNDAAGAFPRLFDLGVDPKTIPSAVSVAMAQRLIRTLNPETRTMRATTDQEKELIKHVFAPLADSSLIPTSIDQVGAEGPDGTGYKGRVGVYEAIFMDDQLAEFLRTAPSASDIAKEAVRQGFLTMAQDGILKALAGQTTLEEVFRVIDPPRH
ncbi:MAG: competence protein ComGA [Parcubacteria bacterium C7867-007]|nr:MAG: competence protein ComGA [Parcubacteria bacterium C7867-007]